MKTLSPEEVLARADSRGMARALVITALSKEIRGVLEHMTLWGSVFVRGGLIFECGEFRGNGRDWLIVAAQSGAGNEAAQAAVMTSRFVFSRFDCMIFVGVAGSRKSDVPVGSVIASNRVYSPYSGKFEAGGFSARPRVYEIPTELVQLAMKVERDDEWQNRIIPSRHGLPFGDPGYPLPFPPTATVAPIISVDAVMANPDSDLEAQIAHFYGDAHGVEMEGFGAIFAAHAERTPGIIIRGVSDMTAEKTAAKDAYLQPIAVSHAAAFAFEMLSLWSPERLEGVPSNPLRAAESDKGDQNEVPQTPLPQQKATRFVLNFEGSATDFPAERLGDILEVVRDVSGDPNASIVGTEEGSFRIMFESPAGFLPVFSETDTNRIEAAAKSNLLGFSDEQSYRDRAGDIADLQRASFDLASWPRSLPGGAKLERPELEQILKKVKDEAHSATVLLGSPGSGKSALLAAFVDTLTQLDWPVLGIKADVLDPLVADERQLQAQLGLSALPSDLIARLANFGPVALVVDQLDALAGFVDVKTGRLNVLLNLIRRFGRHPNVHIVLSARSFEFEHDARLRSIEAESLTLELPPWSEIATVLADKEVNAEGWPAAAQETLRTPQALATFLRFSDTSNREPFENYQAMLERLWTEQVLHTPNGDRLGQLATDIAETMAEQESLWLAASKFDARAADLQALEALGILTRSRSEGAIGFTHQTVYDHVLARDFARGEGRLSAYVSGREASLFLRPKLWSALNYLRGVEPRTYANELRSIWGLPNLRHHLRLLLIEFMGMQPKPIDAELELLREEIGSGSAKPEVFRAIAGSPGWFSALSGAEIPEAMADDPRAAWTTIPVLSRATSFSAEEVTNLLQTHWTDNPDYDVNTWTVLDQAAVWTHEMTDLAVTIIGRTEINQWRLEHLISTVGVDHPESALRLVRAKLERDLSAAKDASLLRASQAGPVPEGLEARFEWEESNNPAKPLKDLVRTSDQDWDVLATLAQHSPTSFINLLWPWFSELSELLSNLEGEHSRKSTYPIRWDFEFQFEDEEGEDEKLTSSEPSILSGFRIGVEGLAKDASVFRDWVKANLEVESLPVQRLIAHGMATDGKTYADDALAFLLGDDRRLRLGGIEDYSATTKALVRAASPWWTAQQTDRFAERVREYRPAPAPDYEASDRRVLLRQTRMLKLGLFKALPRSKTKPELESYIRQEARVFPDEVMGVRRMGGGWVGSPMSAEAMAKASIGDILNAFQDVPDHAAWDHPRDFMRGGNIQLSREFAEFAKAQPQKAASVAREFTPTTGERAAGYALDAMAETADPAIVLGLFNHLTQRQFQSDEFRSSAAHAIQRLSDRKVHIDGDILNLLRSWLSTPEDDRPSAEEITSEKTPNETSDPTNTRSILWDSMHFSVVPQGNFPILQALTAVMLRQDQHDELAEIWESHLDKRDTADVWKALLRFLQYIRPADSSRRGRLIRSIFEQYPAVAQSREAAHLLAHAQWWAIDEVHNALVEWQKVKDPGVQQAFGEIVGLIRIVQPDVKWASDLLARILEGDDPSDALLGATFAAVNLWYKPNFRKRANQILLAVIPKADSRLWSAVFDLFRVVSELSPDAETRKLLESLEEHVRTAGRQPSTFVVDRLRELLPHFALNIGRLADALIDNMRDELGDIRTGASATAPEFVDIAITLHRLSESTREMGIHLFEKLLRVDAYSARQTLDEIDNRLPTRASTRPRLPRRQKRRRRKNLNLNS